MRRCVEFALYAVIGPVLPVRRTRFTTRTPINTARIGIEIGMKSRPMVVVLGLEAADNKKCSEKGGYYTHRKMLRR
jgi:hypothetical protein